MASNKKQRKENATLRYMFLFPLLIQFRSPVYEMIWTSFRVGIPSFGNPLWKHLPGHIQSLSHYFLAVFNPVKLTTQMTNHKPF